MSSTSAPHPLTVLADGGRREVWEPAAGPALVLLDVDGTLMGPTRVVTDAVVAAVKRTVAAGLMVGFATGRPVSGVSQAQSQLNLDGPHIVLNGAQIRKDGEALQSWALSDQQRGDVLDLCASRGLYAELYTTDSLLVTSFDRRYESHWTEVIGMPVGTVEERPDLAGKTIKMTMVTTDDQERSEVVAAIRELGLTPGPATSPVTPGLTYINITRPDADKGTAVRAIAELEGIGTDAIVAIGDGANDLPMLEAVGTAVVMGGADPEVAAAAHFEVGSVEDDGAAQALDAVVAWANTGT